MKKEYLPLLANIAAQILFGLGYFFTRMGMQVVDQDSIKLLSFRFSLAAVALSLLILLRVKKVHYKGGSIWLIFLCGLFNPLISQVLEVTSTSYAPTSQIYMYNSLLPIVMILFSAVINHEYPTKKQLLFSCVTVLGVFIARLTDTRTTGMTPIGLTLISACIIAVSINRALVRRATASFGAFEIVYLTTWMGAIGFTTASLSQHVLAGAPLLEFFAPLQNHHFVISILYLGFGAACAAFLLMTYASANLPYAVYSSTCTISTVVGILAGVLLLRETFQVQEIVGTAVILIGVIGVSFSYDKKDANGNRFNLDNAIRGSTKRASSS